MTAITSSTSATDLLTGNATVTVQDSEQEKQNQFARYLTALKASQLTEMQQKQMQVMSAQDERTKTLEKVNEKERDSDDEKYHEAKDNGYTVAEMRRGLDLLDNVENRSINIDFASAANGVRSLATSGTLSGDIPGGSDQSNGSHMTGTETATNNAPGMTATQVLQESINNAITHTAQTQAIQKNPPSENSYAKSPMAPSLGSDTVGDDETTVSTKAIQHATRQPLEQVSVASSQSAVSLAGMTQVSQRESTKQEMPLDTQTASILKQVGETKEKTEAQQNTLTQNALSATTNTQQLAHDARQQTPSEGRDVAATQILPSTSLAEQVNQAQLTQRVASVFRSFANQKSGTIRMKLHPETLGALTIRMQIDGNEVNAKLEAETETAKQILLENIETLKQKLKDQNLIVKSFDIEVSPKNKDKREIGNNTTTSTPMTTRADTSTTVASESTTISSTRSTLHTPVRKHDNPHVDVIG